MIDAHGRIGAHRVRLRRLVGIAWMRFSVRQHAGGPVWSTHGCSIPSPFRALAVRTAPDRSAGGGEAAVATNAASKRSLLICTTEDYPALTSA